MAKIRAILHRLANKEYWRAFRWYRRRSLRAAARLLDALEAVIDKIERGPEQWPIFRNGIRWVKTKGFPFIFYFDIVSTSRVIVFAVAHAARRPGYWRRRERKP